MNHPDPDHLPPPSDAPDDAPDDALRALIARAGALPTLRPSRDLWPGIAARLDAESPFGMPDTPDPARSAPADAAPGAGRILHFRTPAVARVGRLPRLAAAAVALATLSSGATYLAMRRPADAPPVVASHPTEPASQPVPQSAAATNPSPATRPTAPDPANTPPTSERADLGDPRPATHPHDAPRAVARSVARSVDVAVPGAADYDREIAALRVAVAERHGDLDSATVDVLTRNLRIIDAAIAASRAALARDPHSPFLGEQLTRSLGQKVELLRTVAFLPHT